MAGERDVRVWFALKSQFSPRLCTVNDEMVLRNTSPAETKKAFSTTMPTVFYSQSHQQMKHSSTQTDFL